MMSKNDKNVTLQRMSLRAKRGNPVIKMPLMKSAGLPRRYAPDGTTDMTTSHLTKLHKPQQVIGYSHSTGETTSHPTKQPQNGCQVVGYKPASWQVAGYRNDHLFGSGSSGLGLATSQCGRTA
jgi:hypothetical protein